MSGNSWFRSFRLRLFLEDGAHARDVASHFLQLAGIGELLRRLLHAQAESGAQQLFEFLGKLRRVLGADFTGFHDRYLSALVRDMGCAFITRPSGEIRMSYEVEAWPRTAQTPRAPRFRLLRPSHRGPSRAGSRPQKIQGCPCRCPCAPPPAFARPVCPGRCG